MPLFGLHCNSRGISNFSDQAARMGFRRGVAAGADLLAESLPWALLEPTLGNYDLTYVQRFAEELRGSVQMDLTINVIKADGNASRPADLVGAMDSVAVTTALLNLLTRVHAVIAATPCTVYQIKLGEEIDVYLTANPTDIARFATLLSSAKSHIQGRTGWSAVKVGASFNHEAAGDILTTYAAIAAATSIHNVTYYPINNVTFEPLHVTEGTIVDDVAGDIAAIAVAVNLEPLLISEYGYPSHATLGGDAVLQYGCVFGVTQACVALEVNNVLGCVQYLAHDVGTTLLDLLGLTGNQRLFYASVGLREGTTDAVKPAWTYLVSLMGGRSIEYLAAGDLTTVFRAWLDFPTDPMSPVNEDSADMIWASYGRTGPFDATMLVSKFLDARDC